MGHLLDVTPRPQHRVAPLALICGHANGASFERIEGGDQLVDVPGHHPRHIAQTHQYAVDIVGKRRQAAPQRRTEPTGVVGVLDGDDIALAEGGTHFGRLVAEDNDHRLRLRGKHRVGDARHH